MTESLVDVCSTIYCFSHVFASQLLQYFVIIKIIMSESACFLFVSIYKLPAITVWAC